MISNTVRAIAAAAALNAAAAALASEPVIYQGLLEKDGAPTPDGTYQMLLQVWNDETGGLILGQAFFSVAVDRGLFSIELSPTGFVGEALATPGPLWLRVLVRDPQTFNLVPLEPRQRVGASPKANLAFQLPSLTAAGGVMELFDEAFPSSPPMRILSSVLLPGPRPGATVYGTVIRPREDGHLVIDIAADDIGDSFAVRSDSNFDGVIDAIPFQIRADGQAVFSGNPIGDFALVKFTSSDPSGTLLQFGHAQLDDEPWAVGLSMDPGYEGRFNISDQDADGGPAISIGFDDVLVRSEVTVLNAITIDGADLAEMFDVAASSGVAPLPGMVVSIDPENPGQLMVSGRSYDRKVAGVISGAGEISPALHLRQEGTIADGDFPVAMSGRVFVFVDADAGGPIEPGDLLTTSGTPGHAMRATDRDAMHGAVIGKAMTTLESGRGLVLVLVNLQ